MHTHISISGPLMIDNVSSHGFASHSDSQLPKTMCRDTIKAFDIRAPRHAMPSVHNPQILHPSDENRTGRNERDSIDLTGLLRLHATLWKRMDSRTPYTLSPTAQSFQISDKNQES